MKTSAEQCLELAERLGGDWSRPRVLREIRRMERGPAREVFARHAIGAFLVVVGAIALAALPLWRA